MVGWEASSRLVNEVEIDRRDEVVGVLAHPLLSAADEEQRVLTNGVSKGRIKDGTVTVDPGGFELLGRGIEGPDGRFNVGRAGSRFGRNASGLGLVDVGEGHDVSAR